MVLSLKIFKTYLRTIIPFPKKETIRKIFPTFETKNIGYLINKYGIDTVIDVGANRGQFVEILRSGKYLGKVISFEPLAKEHAIITHKAQKDKNWIIAPRMALGAKSGTVKIQITKDSALSSINATLDSSLFSRAEDIKIETLDKAIKPFISGSSKLLLKIDVQGFEPQVLIGAKKVLKQAQAVMLEVGLVPVYENELPYLELLIWLRKQGFHAVYFSPVINKKKFGEAYQLDAFLVKNPPKKYSKWDSKLLN